MQEKGVLIVLKDSHKNVDSSFIHSSLQMKTIQISFNRRMDAQIILYSCNGIIHKVIKRDRLPKYKTIWMTFKNIMLSQSQMLKDTNCKVTFI